MKRDFYISPTIEIIKIRMESGFAMSDFYNDDVDDWNMIPGLDNEDLSY